MLGNLKAAFGAVIFGLVLLVAAFPLLFLNEKWTVERLQGIEVARSDAITVKSDAVDSKNEGKLVHFHGDAQTDDVLTDPAFGVPVNAIRLTRNVEMFQWMEEKRDGEKENDPPTYTHKKDWDANYHDSRDFDQPVGHENPEMPYGESVVAAKQVKVGAFRLNDRLIRGIVKSEALPAKLEDVPAEMAAKLAVYPGGFYLPMAARDGMPTPAAPSTTTADVPSSPVPGQEVPSQSPTPTTPLDGPQSDSPILPDSAQPDSAQPDSAAPATSSVDSQPATLPTPPQQAAKVEVPAEAQVGDLRISFTVTRPGHVVTVMAKQSGDALVAYGTGQTTEANWLDMDALDKEQVLKKRTEESNMFTWLLRVAGVAMMFFGVLLMMRPLTALANFVPILGSIVGFFAFVIALLVSLVLSLITIAVSWVFVRPIVGIPLLLVAVALAVVAIVLIVRHRTTESVSAAALPN